MLFATEIDTMMFVATEFTVAKIFDSRILSSFPVRD